MAWKLKCATVAGLAVGTALGAGGVSVAGQPVGSGMVTGIFHSGDVRGIAVVRRTRPGRARVAVSLGGLPRDASLVVDTEPCASRPDRGDVVLGIIMANTEGDFHFRSTPARLRQRIGKAQTVRIYDSSGSGAASQVACTRTRLT